MPGTEPRLLVAPVQSRPATIVAPPCRLRGAGPGWTPTRTGDPLTMAMSGRANSRDELDALRSDDRLRPPRRWNSIGFVLPSHPVLTPASCNLRPVGPALAKLSDEAGRALPLSALLERRRRARCFSGSESSVTIVLGCLFPRSRRRRHFGDDLGWHLNLGFFFLIWRPVNFRLLRRSGWILDDDGFSGRTARRLGHGIGHGLFEDAVYCLGR